MKDLESLSPAELHSHRHQLGIDDPLIDETVIWYMAMHPEADEARVRSEVARRAKHIETDDLNGKKPPSRS